MDLLDADSEVNAAIERAEFLHQFVYCTWSALKDPEE